MNPIALRLHEAALTLDGGGMSEIVAMLEIAEREINRLDELVYSPRDEGAVRVALRHADQATGESTDTLALKRLAEEIRRLRAPPPSRVAGVCFHGSADGACRVDGCRHCKNWSIEKLIEAFDLTDVPRGITVTIPYAQTRDALLDLKRLREMINTPQIMEFMTAVQIEAIHQRERWGVDHDAGKADTDWFWLIGYLAGKAVHASSMPPDAINPDSIPPTPIVTKQLHHIITTAAACLNWHAHKIGDSMCMRPGIEPPKSDS